MFVGLALGPFVIHRADTLSIWGNETYTPSPSPAQVVDWRNTINYQMFYYLLAQAIFGFILLFWTLFGKLTTELDFLIVLAETCPCLYIKFVQEWSEDNITIRSP